MIWNDTEDFSLYFCLIQSRYIKVQPFSWLFPICSWKIFVPGYLFADDLLHLGDGSQWGKGFIHGHHDSLCRGDPRVSLSRCISFSTLREMPRTSPSLQPTDAFCNKKRKVSLIFLSTHAKTPSVLNHELGIFSNSRKTWVITFARLSFLK